MKMRNWGSSVLAVAALFAAGAVSGLAQGPGGDMGPGMGVGMGSGMGPHRPPMERAMGGRGMGEHGRWWNEPKMVEKLKLTDVQRKAMDDIFQQNRLTLVDLHASLEKQELQMEPLIRADQPDEAKVLAQIDKVAQARAELEKANARMLLGLRRQLTPEQWKQVEEDRATRREGRGMGGRMGRGPRDGGPPPPPPAAGGPGPGMAELVGPGEPGAEAEQ